MKKTMLVAIVMLLAGSAMAGGAKYQQAMGKTLGGFAECKTVADYQELGNKFMVIANAEPDEWLPLYYQAQCYILMSFTESEHPEKKDEYLDVAETSIDKMVAIAPGESEVFVMQGLLYTARLVVDPMTRGQKYGALSGQSVGRALGMEPENPRARYMQIANEMGTARFFGSDISVFCEKASTLYAEWDNYQTKSSISPRWGKAQLADIMKQCGGSEKE